MMPRSGRSHRCGRLLSAAGFLEQTLVPLRPFAGLAGLQSKPIFLEALFTLGGKHRVFSGADR
jgi:hypothetical protein